jgi:hypothetical protein
VSALTIRHIRHYIRLTLQYCSYWQKQFSAAFRVAALEKRDCMRLPHTRAYDLFNGTVSWWLPEPPCFPVP